jgi:type II secretory ATPase GspE/PulE/Tfp pilus assembly ATPase PilB-like protein
VLAEITEAERAWIRDSDAVAPDSLWKPVGCDSCAGTGINGRIGIFEVWRLTTEARTLILHGADEQALKHHAVASETRLLMVDAIDKAASGLTTLSELRSLYWQRATPPPAS